MEKEKGKEEEVKKVGAKIKDVKLYTNNDYFLSHDRVVNRSEAWMAEPKGISVSDDVIIVTAETKGGDVVTEAFNVVLKYDQTLQPTSLSRKRRYRRGLFAGFLKAYITDDMAKYKVVENLGTWVGMDIKVLKEDEQLSIIIPSAEELR